MNPLMGSALISAGGSLLGGMFGGSSSAKAAKQAAQLNIMAAKNAHQWEVQDLRKAGLNPILSGTGGSGAHTAAAPVADVPDWANILGDAGQKITNAHMLKAQARLLDSQAENTDADTRNKNYDWQLKREYAPLEKQASLWETKTRIKNIIQSTAHSAVDTKTKTERLKRELADPELQQWIISEGYATQKQIDRALSGSADWSDLASILKNIVKIGSAVIR